MESGTALGFVAVCGVEQVQAPQNSDRVSEGAVLGLKVGVKAGLMGGYLTCRCI